MLLRLGSCGLLTGCPTTVIGRGLKLMVKYCPERGPSNFDDAILVPARSLSACSGFYYRQLRLHDPMVGSQVV
jgi:hypothetical protein